MSNLILIRLCVLLDITNKNNARSQIKNLNNTLKLITITFPFKEFK